MRKRLVINTSTGCLDYISHSEDVRILRIPLEFHGEKYLEGYDLDPKWFFNELSKIDTKNDLPKSIQPSISSICEQFENYYNEGYDEFIIISLSSGLSGTINGINIAKEMLSDKIKIHIFDAKIACYPEGYMALKAAEMVRNNIPTEKIINELEWIRDNNRLFFVVGNLDFLIYNGRLKGAKAYMGKIMNVNPILWFNEDGVIEALDKVRTTRKAIDNVIEKFQAYTEGKKFIPYISYAANDYLELMRSKLYEKTGLKDVFEIYLSTISTCHVGEKIIALGAILERD